MRKIGGMIGVSSTILHRYFGTKAALFEAALRDAMHHPSNPENRAEFGKSLADILANPEFDISPHTMTLLASADPEAQEVAARVLHDREVVPLAQWLGPPDAEIRAHQIFALCAGFVYHARQLTARSQSADVDPRMVGWFARGLQAIVDGRWPGAESGPRPGPSSD